MRTFTVLTPKIIAESIHSADRTVIYVSPGLDEIIASALVNATRKLGANNVTVLLDVTENICRFGYGTIEGVTLLRENNVVIRQADGLRIGALLCDNKGWIFSPTPLLIEAGKEDVNQPNSIEISPDQIIKIRCAISPSQGNLKNPPEIGLSQVKEEKLESVEKAVRDNPPQKFDVARKVQVFNTAIEFVEISLRGCEIQRHTVSIPPKLLVGEVDQKTAKQLKGGFNIIESTSKLSGESIRYKVNELRKNYTRSIPKYGNLLLKAKKAQFEKELKNIREDIKKFQEEVKNELKNEIEAAKERLVNLLSSAIKNNPPKDLLGQIPNNHPTDKQIADYLKNEVKIIFPSEEKLIKEMALDCIIKGVTYEILSNEEFQKLAQDAFPYLEWVQLFEEFDAARESESLTLRSTRTR